MSKNRSRKNRQNGAGSANICPNCLAEMVNPKLHVCGQEEVSVDNAEAYFAKQAAHNNTVQRVSEVVVGGEKRHNNNGENMQRRLVDAFVIDEKKRKEHLEQIISTPEFAALKESAARIRAKRGDGVEDSFICKHCGKNCHAAIGLRSHIKAAHKDKEALANMGKIVEKLNKFADDMQRTAEEAHVQAQEEAAMWHSVEALESAIGAVDKAVLVFEKMPAELLELPKYQKPYQKALAQQAEYQLLLAELMVNPAVARGKAVATKVEVAERRREALVECEKLNQKEAKKNTSGWVADETERFAAYMNGSVWIPTKHKKWQEHGAMPFVVDFCWRVVNTTRKMGLKIKRQDIVANNVIDLVFSEQMERHLFTSVRTEVLRHKVWSVDDAGNRIGKDVTEEVILRLPFGEWKAELENAFWRFLDLFWKGDDVVKAWATKNNHWGDKEVPDVDRIHVNFNAGKYRYDSIAAGIDADTREKLAQMASQSGDPEAEEL